MTLYRGAVFVGTVLLLSFLWIGNGRALDLPSLDIQTARLRAERGDVDAQQLGQLLLRSNPDQALAWLRKAAEKGDAIAQFELGICFLNGDGTPTNDREALRWIQMAAEQGFGEAQGYLGHMYLEGAGVKRDYTMALKWLRIAAKQGDSEGQYFLGLMFRRGLGTTKNLPEAVKWFRHAAEQGEDRAQLLLGLMYKDGVGIARDLVNACVWITLAGKGYQAEEARAHLTKLRARLTEAQLVESQRLIRHWEIHFARKLAGLQE